jgi:hypothetical protein
MKTWQLTASTGAGALKLTEQAEPKPGPGQVVVRVRATSLNYRDLIVAMAPVGEQMGMPGSRTNPNLLTARFLLKPGRKYDEAVKTFQPYDKVKEKNPDARAAGKALIAEGKSAGPDRKTFIYVNNRLEGNALETIDAMLDAGAS